jgi:hypothetical protein
VDNKSAVEERVVQTLGRLNIVNDALLKAESDGAGVIMLTFAEFVLRACFLPHSEFLSGNSLRKLSC